VRRGKIYYRNHRELFYSFNAARRQSEKNRSCHLTEEQKGIMATIYGLSSRVSKCLGIKHHVDHIVPLKPKKGSGIAPGWHEPSNLQVLPARINLSKHNRLMEVTHLRG
jgi:hypothetical protein